MLFFIFVVSHEIRMYNKQHLYHRPMFSCKIIRTFAPTKEVQRKEQRRIGRASHGCFSIFIDNIKDAYGVPYLYQTLRKPLVISNSYFRGGRV